MQKITSQMAEEERFLLSECLTIEKAPEILISG